MNNRIAIVIFPFAASSIYSWGVKVTKVIANLSNSVFVVSGLFPQGLYWPEGVILKDIKIKMHYVDRAQICIISALFWIFKMIFAQILIARDLFWLRNQIDIVFFTLGIYYQLPLLVAKLTRKKILWGYFGISSKSAKSSYQLPVSQLFRVFEWIGCKFSDRIVIEGVSIGLDPSLTHFKHKLVNGALYLDQLDIFNSSIPYTQRDKVVGYIGRLGKDKGITEFIQSIPIILNKDNSLRFMIIGSGSLEDQIPSLLEKLDIIEKVLYITEVSHHEVAKYLNHLRLLVLASPSEGLPNIILESLGCGTPVLATRVGSIPDIIIHEKTGFLLDDVSTICIADGVLKSLAYPKLNEVILSGYQVIKKAYTLEAAISRYKLIIHDL
jgi:glycosyltransferase involved in cell wall biosynthesis